MIASELSRRYKETIVVELNRSNQQLFLSWSNKEINSLLQARDFAAAQLMGDELYEYLREGPVDSA